MYRECENGSAAIGGRENKVDLSKGATSLSKKMLVLQQTGQLQQGCQNRVVKTGSRESLSHNCVFYNFNAWWTSAWLDPFCTYRAPSWERLADTKSGG